MKHRLFRLHGFLFKWRTILSEEVLAVFLAFLVFMPLAAVPMRFSERSLFMQSTVPSATTSYTVSFQYMTPEAVGSVDMLFCIDPIPYMPCVTPPGLDVSNAVLSEQTGETGFSISTQSTNRIVLSRTPSLIPPGGNFASYKFDNIKNPVNTTPSFSIRLKSLASTNGTGPQIDFGSIKGQISNPIEIETQVPPMLIFCAAGEVQDDCSSTNENFFTDMGEMSADSTLIAQSQMAVGTNATAGFVIITNGSPPAAATNVINASTTPTCSCVQAAASPGSCECPGVPIAHLRARFRQAVWLPQTRMEHHHSQPRGGLPNHASPESGQCCLQALLDPPHLAGPFCRN